MRALGVSVGLAVLVLAAAAYWPQAPAPPPRRSGATPPASPSRDLPAPPPVPSRGPTTEPDGVAPTPSPPTATPDTLQVPNQDRLHAELTKALSLDPQQSQRVREVLDRHARKIAELLRAERDDAFAERKARAQRAFTDDLLSVLTAEQQIALEQTALWKRMIAPPGVDAGSRSSLSR